MDQETFQAMAVPIKRRALQLSSRNWRSNTVGLLIQAMQNVHFLELTKKILTGTGRVTQHCTT